MLRPAATCESALAKCASPMPSNPLSTEKTSGAFGVSFDEVRYRRRSTAVREAVTAYRESAGIPEAVGQRTRGSVYIFERVALR